MLQSLGPKHLLEMTFFRGGHGLTHRQLVGGEVHFDDLPVRADTPNDHGLQKFPFTLAP